LSEVLKEPVAHVKARLKANGENSERDALIDRIAEEQRCSGFEPTIDPGNRGAPQRESDQICGRDSDRRPNALTANKSGTAQAAGNPRSLA